MQKSKTEMEKKTLFFGIGNSIKTGGNIIKQKVCIYF